MAKIWPVTGSGSGRKGSEKGVSKRAVARISESGRGRGRWHGSTLIYLQAVVKGESWKLKFWLDGTYLFSYCESPSCRRAWQRNYICTFNLLNVSNALSDSHMCYDSTRPLGLGSVLGVGLCVGVGGGKLEKVCMFCGFSGSP